MKKLGDYKLKVPGEIYKQDKQDMKEKIKPCPFCGSKGVVMKKGYSSESYYDVACSNKSCYLQNGSEWWWYTEDEAIRKWNHRPIENNK